jgi:hypothetical protein
MRWRRMAWPVILLSFAFVAQGPGARASSPGGQPGFHAPVKLPGSEGGSEPYIALDPHTGYRYGTWQAPGQFAGSPDGVNFTPLTTPDPGADGDTSDAVDAAGALYNAQICGTPPDTLHTCIYKSFDGGRTWPQVTQLADNHPGASDRPWIDVYPKNGSNWNTNNTTVYLEYHTFSPEDLAYVTVSTDGGRTFGLPVLIEGDTNAIVGSGCNTVPSGIVVDQKTKAVYATWLSGNDVVHNGITGCNYSQVGPFDKAWVSASTDGGTAWTANLAWQGQFDPVTNVGDNANKIFGTIGVDQNGQVQLAVPVRFNDDPVTFVTQGTENPANTHVLFTTSPDGGAHWTKAFDTSPKLAGSQFFPWIVAGSGGRADLIYYQTSSRKPNDPSDRWYVLFMQARNLLATLKGGQAVYAKTPAVVTVKLDANVIHTGGICTFGIFCSVTGGDRSLADSISIALDPAGGANAIWTNNGGGDNEIDFACQSSGSSAFAGKPNLKGCYVAG